MKRRMKESGPERTMPDSTLHMGICNILAFLLLSMGRPCTLLQRVTILDIIIHIPTGAKRLHMATMIIMLRLRSLNNLRQEVLTHSQRGDIISTISTPLSRTIHHQREEEITEEDRICRLGFPFSVGFGRKVGIFVVVSWWRTLFVYCNAPLAKIICKSHEINCCKIGMMG